MLCKYLFIKLWIVPHEIANIRSVEKGLQLVELK